MCVLWLFISPALPVCWMLVLTPMALHLAVPLSRIVPSCSIAASPTPTPTPKLFSWAAKSHSPKLGAVLVGLLYNAAVNGMLPFVRSCVIQCRWPFFDK